MLKPSGCNGCILQNRGESFTQSEGDGRLGVVILGEAAGREEAIEGLPFRPKAAAGSQLEQLFRLASTEQRKISRNDFFITNVVRCKPPGNDLAGMPYEKSAINQCHTYFDGAVGGFKPKMHTRTILAMGNIPLQKMLSVSGDPKEKQSIKFLRGFVYETKYGPCVPTYHPSYLKRGAPNLTPLVVEDLKRSIAVANGSYTNYIGGSGYIKPNYNEHPSIDDCNSFANRIEENEQLLITPDIETPRSGELEEDELEDAEDTEDYKRITMVQFSVKMRTGIAMPFTREYMPYIKRILASPNRKAGYNWWDFDAIRLRNEGITVNGRIDDIMWMFKMYHPRLPRGLQSVASMFDFPFPWKHLYGSKLAWYGCADVDAPRWILAKLPKLMQDLGVWKGYENNVYTIHNILDRASDRGIPVDVNRLDSLKEILGGEKEVLHKDLQEIIPDELKNITPKKKDKETGAISYGYVRDPKEVKIAKKEYEAIVQIANTNGKRVIAFNEYVRRSTGLLRSPFDFMDESTGEPVTIERWHKLQEFKSSSQQVLRYLKWKKSKLESESKQLFDSGDKKGSRELEKLAKDYEIPMTLAKTKEGKESRETTGGKELEEMFFKTGDNVLEKIMDIRSIGTTLTNFIPNWTPGVDGRVHSRYGFVAPTGQKNWKRPNIVNASKHKPMGQRFRYCINAPTGYTFLEFDKKSCHVGTMGYQAKSSRYIRFSQLDPHTIFASYIMPKDWGEPVDLSWSDSDILLRCKEIKKRSKIEGDKPHGIDIRQQCAKPTVLGNQLGLGPVKLQRQNRRFIQTIKEAEEYQRTLAELFPEVDQAKDSWQKKADRQHFLYCKEFGFIQWFYDVYQMRFNAKWGKWEQKNGSDSEKVLGFVVQTPAFGMMDYELMEMEEKGINEEHNYLVSIHDSNGFLPEEGKVDKCIEEVGKIMNAPCPMLVNEVCPNGLAIGVECNGGRNWQYWDKDKNPEGMKEIKI